MPHVSFPPFTHLSLHPSLPSPVSPSPISPPALVGWTCGSVTSSHRLTLLMRVWKSQLPSIMARVPLPVHCMPCVVQVSLTANWLHYPLPLLGLQYCSKKHLSPTAKNMRSWTMSESALSLHFLPSLMFLKASNRCLFFFVSLAFSLFFYFFFLFLWNLSLNHFRDLWLFLVQSRASIFARCWKSREIKRKG